MTTGLNQEWQVESSKGRCAASGKELSEGEEFYSVLFDDPTVEGGFRRADYSVEAWSGVPEGAYCHFKTHVPIKEKKRRLLVDNEVLVNFFVRLSDEADELRIQFRFVLALILMRKRLLRYDGSETIEGVETWRMTLTHDQSEYRVVNPRLTEAQIEGVSGQLGAILHGNASDSGPSDGASEKAV